MDARHGARPRSDGERLLSVDSRSGRHRCPARGDRRRRCSASSNCSSRPGSTSSAAPTACSARRPAAPLPPSRGCTGSPQTGTVDAATDAALVKAASGTAAAPAAAPSSYVGLRVGSTGPAVTKLQQAIMATGLVVRGGADGIFGQQTRTALLIYQRVNGLPQTGIVDEATARLLGLLDRPAAAGGVRPAAARRRPGSRATTSAAPVSSPCRRR